MPIPQYKACSYKTEVHLTKNKQTKLHVGFSYG